MYNSAQHITKDNLDGLLRAFLLEADSKPDVQKMFNMQSGFVFSGSETKENFLPLEKKLIEKLAKATGYASPKGDSKGLFAWIFSSLLVFVILFFLWKLFTMSDNNALALQVKRHTTGINISNHTPEKKNIVLPVKLLPVIVTKNDSIQTHVPNSINATEEGMYYSDTWFPSKCPQIVYHNGKGNIFLNLNFEIKSPNTELPDVWYAGDGGVIGGKVYTVNIDSSVKFSCKNSIMFQRIEKKPNNLVFGVLTNSVPVEYFKGTDSIKISVYIKTDNVREGYAGIWCNEWNDISNTTLQFTNSYLQGGTGTSDWKKYTIMLPIDTDARWINFGGLLNGTGTVWFDKFEVSLDGEKIKDITPIIKSPEINEIDWLNKNCIPIKTLDIRNGIDDLEKMNDIVGDAKIVALGGSSYGNSEEFKMKQRISEYLVKEKNFSIICLDAGMPDVSLLNNYIQTGTGDPKSILDSLYSWNYNCKEMLNNIEWLRSFSQSSNFKLSLYGAGDMRQGKALQILQDFAMKNDKKLLKQILKYEEKYSGVLEKKENYINQYAYVNIPQTEKLSREIMPLMNKICSQFENNKEIYLNNVTSTQYEWLKQMLVILKQNLEQLVSSISNNNTNWNKDWAENIKWIINQNPDAKIILWFVNSTIEKENKSLSTGTLLSNEYGSKYVALGFATGNGSFTAYKDSILSVNKMSSSAMGTYEDYFSQCKYPDFILDLKKSSISDPSAKWLDNEMWLRRLWNFYYDKQFFRQKIVGNYDAIVFLRNTTHSDCFDMGMKFKTFQ
jgi:erythromycin esterase